MITVRKLASLPEQTRLRKSARVLAVIVREPGTVSARYLNDLLSLIAAEPRLSAPVRERACALLGGSDSDRSHELAELLVVLESALGLEPAEWDLSPGSESTEGSRAGGSGALSGVTLYAELIRSPFNLGSIVRTAVAFGVPEVMLSSGVVAHRHSRFRRSAMGADQFCRVVEGTALPRSTADCPVIALETGGTPVSSFAFPERGILLIGSEELGLSPAALDASDATVAVPMPGAKASINVGVAVGIVLAWWSAACALNREG